MARVVKIRDEANVDKRHAGCGVVVGDNFYLWGGSTEDKISFHDSEDSDSDNSDDEGGNDMCVAVSLPRPHDDLHPFDVFDIANLTWHSQTTYGILKKDVPDLGNGSTLSYHKDTHSMYIYGGWNDRQFSSDVYCVSMDTWKWEKIALATKIQPSPRYLTGVLVYSTKICNFGGTGPEIVPGQDEGAEYRSYTEDNVVYEFGWNNEYYEFDVIEKEWIAPISGKGKHRPLPVAGHVFTRFDDHRAVYFGGKGESGMTDVTYIFDLEKKEFDGPLALSHRPMHRRFATLCPLIDPDIVGTRLCFGGPTVQQKLFLLWGKMSHQQIVEDGWIFHCGDWTWSKVKLDEVGRYWHIACPHYCQPGKSTEGQVIIYGGCKHNRNVAGVQFFGLKDLTILSFGTKSLQKMCMSVIVDGLQEQKLPESDQIPAKLPSYIPSAVVQSIVNAYRAHSHII